MKNPCYNTETRTDCKDRCAGCSATCKKWAEYVKKRDSQYTENPVNMSIYELERSERIKKYMKNGMFRKRK
jgi:hypothetical protein